jgi:hypothetical protein
MYNVCKLLCFSNAPYAMSTIYRYGRDAVVQRLTPLCPVDLAKSSKLQDAEWLGKVANAARDGDAAAMKTLLQHERAKQRIKKLRKPMEVRAGMSS